MNQSQQDQQGARLVEARKADGRYSSAAAAAEAMGVPAPTYQGHENGSRGFKGNADRYADFYKVNLSWLWSGRGPMKRDASTSGHAPAPDDVGAAQKVTSPELNIQSMPRDLPILGSGSCGEDGLFELNGQTHDHARRPPRLAGAKDAYAIYVQGESMSPWREQGQLVYVHPHQPPKIGDYVVVQLHPENEDGMPAAYIKKLVKRTGDKLVLMQYNPREEKTIPLRKVKEVHRIVDWDELMGL